MGHAKQVFSFSVVSETHHLFGMAEFGPDDEVYFIECFRQDHWQEGGKTVSGPEYEVYPDTWALADRLNLEAEVRARRDRYTFQINGVHTVYDITCNAALPTHDQYTPHPGFQVVRSIRHISGRRIQVTSTGSLDETLSELKAAVIF